jgi:hypothetical protein
LDFDLGSGDNGAAIARSLRGIADWLFFGCLKWRGGRLLGVAAGRLLAASEVAAHLVGGKLL